MNSTFSFQTTTGRGPAKVQVGYEMDSDGDVYDMEVSLLGSDTDITASMDDDQFESLVDSCHDHFDITVKSHNDDMAIERSLSAREYQECI